MKLGSCHCLTRPLSLVIIFSQIAAIMIISSPASAALVNFPAITINGDADFASQAALNGWPGDGSAANPFIIQNYCINSTDVDYWWGGAITISSVNAHFIVRDCVIEVPDHTGIKISGTGNGTLINNTITAMTGMGVGDCFDLLVDNNTFNVTWYAIHVGQSDSVTYSNNNLTSTGEGFRLEYSTNQLLLNNSISTVESGVVVESCTKLTMRVNDFNHTGAFIYDEGQTFVTLVFDSSNSVDGKPVCFMRNQSGASLPANAGQVILYNCSHMTVANQTIHGPPQGIAFFRCSNISVLNNTCIDCYWHGISFENSADLIVANNNCSFCWHGITTGLFAYELSRCQIVNNECYKNRCMGIYATGVEIELENNTCCCNERTGINIDTSSSTGNVTAIGNRCDENLECGIGVMSYSKDITLTDNNCSYNVVDGIQIGYNTMTSLRGNTLLNNTRFGIYFDFHSSILSTKMRANVLSGNGVFLQYFGEWTIFEGDVDSSNTVNGKPLYLISNTVNATIPNDAGQVILANCSNVRVDSVDISNATIGIILTSSSNITISNSTIKSNSISGICIDWSRDNRIVGNNISRNGVGVLIMEGSASNGVCFNSIYQNQKQGVAIDSGDVNLNWYPWIESSWNVVVSNDFIGNNNSTSAWNSTSIQASDQSISSSWDLRGKGNYWSDWTAPDLSPADGIIDSPYNITGTVCDHFPLADHPVFVNSPPIAYFTVSPSSCNATSAFTFDPSGSFDLEDTTSKLIVRWDWTSDGTWDTGWSAPAAIDYQYPASGTYTVSMEVNDTGGLTNTTSRGAAVDNSAPTTVASVIGSTGANGIFISNISIVLNVSDTGGSGVNFTRYRVNEGIWQNYSGAINITSDGTYSVDYYSEDLVGNIESVRSTEVKIDRVPPSTEASCIGTLGSDGWYISNVSLDVVASDSVSGVNATFYRIGTSGSWSKYSSTLTLSSEGSSLLQFFSMDNASNNETVKSIVIKIDSIAPTLTIITANNTVFSSDQVEIAFDISDAVSGVYYYESSFDGFTPPSNTTLDNLTGTYSCTVRTQLTEGTHYIVIRVVDKAGNVKETRLDFKVHISGSLIVGVPDWLLFLVIIIGMATVLASVLLMRMKKSPPKRLDEMKPEQPAPPAV